MDQRYQFLNIVGIGKVGLGNDDQIGECHLLARLVEFRDLVAAIDGDDDAIQAD